MRALLSVSDKTGLIDFAGGLVDRGVEVVSTGGTARAIATAGIPVTGVSEVTGFPEMMDGRVKTLHPAVHGGILARRDRADDILAIAGQGIIPIDLVVVNLYPFAETAASDASVDDLIEQIDIGGPSMVRAGGQELRGCPDCGRPERLRAGARRARPDGRPRRRDGGRSDRPAVPLRVGAKGVRAYRRLRCDDRGHARRGGDGWRVVHPLALDLAWDCPRPLAPAGDEAA